MRRFQIAVFETSEPSTSGLARVLSRADWWVALGTAGEVLATLTMDAEMDVLDIGPDYVIVLTRDDFDVQEVQLRRFRPRT